MRIGCVLWAIVALTYGLKVNNIILLICFCCVQQQYIKFNNDFIFLSNFNYENITFTSKCHATSFYIVVFGIYLG